VVVVVKGCKSKWKKTDYVAETHIKRERERERNKERKEERKRSMANFKVVARTRRDILACLYCVCVCVCVCVRARAREIQRYWKSEGNMIYFLMKCVSNILQQKVSFFNYV
jgi:hypothetical protein